MLVITVHVYLLVPFDVHLFGPLLLVLFSPLLLSPLCLTLVVILQINMRHLKN
jgi:hypothetical protein